MKKKSRKSEKPARNERAMRSMLAPGSLLF
jgi:hypothetical protein